ncbi:MAG TPA: hypothetical protein VH643_28435 [Gemmataceae bacterium]
MPMQEQGTQQSKPAIQTQEQRSGVIIGQLMQALGRPTALYRVEVRHLWDNHYRANVFVGDTVTSTRITHSFFLMADEDGNIVGSVPDILRKY